MHDSITINCTTYAGLKRRYNAIRKRNDGYRPIFIGKHPFVYSHTASCRGYASKDVLGTIVPYEGRFGRGFIKFLGRHRGSTTYMDISYWVEP